MADASDLPILPRAAIAIELAAIASGLVLGGIGGLCVMLAAASAARALRRQRWFGPEDGDRAAAWSAVGGALAGVAAAGLALAIAPVLARAGLEPDGTDSAPSPRSWLASAVGLVAIAAAAELVFRRWLLASTLALVRAGGQSAAVARAVAIAVAAALEAAVVPLGDGAAWSRIGTAMTSAGLGALYVSSEGRLAACLTARLTAAITTIGLRTLGWWS